MSQQTIELAREAEYILNSFTFGTEVESLTNPCRTISSLESRAERLGWCTHRDVSVSNDGSREGCELVSPKMRMGDYRDTHLPFITDFLPVIVPTDTAGTHVHVGVHNIPSSNKTKMKLVENLVSFWGTHERFIMSRIANRKATRAHWSKMISHSPFKKELAQKIASCSSISDLGHSIGHDNRYRTLNLFSLAEHGTVEFRLWNSDTDLEYFSKSISFSFAITAYAYLKASFPKSFSEENFMDFNQFQEFYEEIRNYFAPDYAEKSLASLLSPTVPTELVLV